MSPRCNECAGNQGHTPGRGGARRPFRNDAPGERPWHGTGWGRFSSLPGSGPGCFLLNGNARRVAEPSRANGRRCQGVSGPRGGGVRSSLARRSGLGVHGRGSWTPPRRPIPRAARDGAGLRPGCNAERQAAGQTRPSRRDRNRDGSSRHSPPLARSGDARAGPPRSSGSAPLPAANALTRLCFPIRGPCGQRDAFSRWGQSRLRSEEASALRDAFEVLQEVGRRRPRSGLRAAGARPPGHRGPAAPGAAPTSSQPQP